MTAWLSHYLTATQAVAAHTHCTYGIHSDAGRPRGIPTTSHFIMINSDKPVVFCLVCVASATCDLEQMNTKQIALN